MQQLEETMAVNAVRLSGEVMEAVVAYAPVNSRSIPKQIEHWVKIGKLAEENPDLPYNFIKDALEAKLEIEHGEVSIFNFRKG
jgi:hypothetical protein